MKALFIIGVIVFIWLATKNMMDFAKRGVKPPLTQPENEELRGE